MCKKTCPNNNCNDNYTYEHKDFYAAIYEDKDARKRSRSGGIFYAFAKNIIEQNGIVYGAALLEDLSVKIIRVDSLEKLSLLQGSKYVQADKTDIFESVRKDLSEGYNVLYSGTGCEVAGLLSYLKTTNTNTDCLLTIDLICHGVPSPKIWNENIDYLERKWKCKILDANFRDKQFGWKSHIESYKCSSKNKVRVRYSNMYTSLFYSSIFLRLSCHECRYCNFERTADLTIGDFWGSIHDKSKQYSELIGTTQIMPNTNKGEQAIKVVSGVVFTSVSKEAFSFQPNLFRPTKKSPKRMQFWNDYKQNGFDKIMGSYYKLTDRLRLLYNLLKLK